MLVYVIVVRRRRSGGNLLLELRRVLGVRGEMFV